MTRGSRVVAVLVVYALALASAAYGQAVDRVVDGDTIIVRGVGSVRLIGVDTPETVDPRKPVEFFGREASDFTKRLVDGQQVRLEYDWQRTDKYGRTLAYVYLLDGTFVNAEIVRQGYGHAYVVYPFKYLEEFRQYEREAREAKRGLWAAAVAPNAASTPEEDPVSTTVYVTRTGQKYHRDGCRYLARSKIAMPLAEAATRYGPCSVCKPPIASKLNESVREAWKDRNAGRPGDRTPHLYGSRGPEVHHAPPADERKAPGNQRLPFDVP